MIKLVATNITSPLGMTTQANWQEVKAGHSALRTGFHPEGTALEACVGAFSPEQWKELEIPGFSRFESILIRSVREALGHCSVDISSDRTLFVISTTKANVDQLGETAAEDGTYDDPGAAAAKIAEALGVRTEAVVSCNACVSGLSALLLAERMTRLGFYDSAVVCGADCVSTFLISGFSSLQAISPQPCKPFDIERLGMNIGEAAATMVFTLCDDPSDTSWKIVSGFLDNDAYHISAPRSDAEGLSRAIVKTLENSCAPAPAMVCAHGSSTMFNDQMESVAIQKSALSDVPLTALKAFYGHTMGASAILEAILVTKSLDEGRLLPMKGFSEIGVGGKINVCTQALESPSRTFLKIISGFGGCNGALLLSSDPLPATADSDDFTLRAEAPLKHSLHTVKITSEVVAVDGKVIPTHSEGLEILTEIYREEMSDWPKFYKMDPLSRLVFLASVLVCKDEVINGEETGIIVFNRTSSVLADRRHISGIKPDSYYPSPAAFSYTLPNIAVGEAAIRLGLKGESSLFILPYKDKEMMDKVIRASFLQKDSRCFVCGWADFPDEKCFEAEFELVKLT